MKVMEHQPPKVAHMGQRDKVIFLAGPIQGAPDWQAEAVHIFKNSSSKQEALHICNPRRSELPENFDYQQQVAWEKAYLMRSAQLGTIAFWFAARDFKLPYPEDRSYAQTSRVEFGRALGWKDRDPSIQISLGIEPGYSGSEKYFKTCADEFDLPVFATLEETCLSALALATQIKALNESKIS